MSTETLERPLAAAATDLDLDVRIITADPFVASHELRPTTVKAGRRT